MKSNKGNTIMIYKDLLTLFVIFAIILSLGIRIAEEGLNAMMGLDIRPKSFNFIIFNDRTYDLSILGKTFKFQKYYKVGEIFVGKGCMSLKINEKQFTLYSLIPARTILKDRQNVDKKPANRYN